MTNFPRITKGHILTLITFGLIFLMITPAISQETDDYAIIYVYRLKKSTESDIKFKVLVGGEYVDSFDGVNSAFSAEYAGKWIACKRGKNEKCLVKINYNKKDKFKAKLMLDVRVGKRYFLEFNPAVGYGENPLRLMSNHEGFELLVMSDIDDINIIDADIKMQVKKEKDNGYFEESATEEIAYVDEPDNGTTQYRGGGDPLKGLNVSSAKKEMEIGNYYALIIGIDNYTGHWSNLNNAVNDAKAVEDILKTRYKIDHFKTMYNENATRTKIITELEWLVANVKEKDNVFIYYSGHGEFKQDLNKGYWVPIDATTNSTSQFISNNDIQTFLGGIKSKHTLLVSDACFSGDIFRGNTISVPYEDSDKYYKKVHDLVSRQAISSGGIEPVMDGGRDGHSVFAYYLLKSLKNNTNRYFDASQLYSNIKIPVTNNSDQSPKFQPIKNTGDEGGQFIFIRK